MYTDGGSYYTLVASLPALPRFDRATRLPITRRQLDARLRMLHESDARAVERLERFLEWQHYPLGETSEAVYDAYQKTLEVVEHPALRDMITFRMNLRTIMSALRRRHAGHGPPRLGEVWGVGRWVRHVQRNWSDPHLGLSAAQPWVQQAHELLIAGESMELERLLMGLIWDHLDRLAEGRYFTLEVVLAYLFKWDILTRWLSYDGQRAREHMQELVDDAIEGYGALFP